MPEARSDSGGGAQIAGDMDPSDDFDPQSEVSDAQGEDGRRESDRQARTLRAQEQERLPKPRRCEYRGHRDDEPEIRREPAQL